MFMGLKNDWNGISLSTAYFELLFFIFNKTTHTHNALKTTNPDP